jgi:hypothetical protein
MKNNNNNFTPAAKRAVYENAKLQPFELRARMFGARCMHACRGKKQIMAENKGKSGIYCVPGCSALAPQQFKKW